MKKLLAILLGLTALLPLALTAQERKITPVDVDESKPKQPTLHYYDKHGNPLQEPVLFLAELDTVKKKVNAGPVYPLLTTVNVGVNIFDAFMNCFGQSFGSVDVFGELPLFNWFVPTVELGVGWGSQAPKDNNYRYKANPSFFAKLGFNYNFLYKSNPDYQVYVGFRAGFSPMSYTIKDVTVNGGYWDQTVHPEIGKQTATAFYGQALAGLKVKIYKEFSLGWSVRYNFKFNSPHGSASDPWYIPGMGGNNKLSATFSLIYTLPLTDMSKARKDRPGTETVTPPQTNKDIKH